MSLEWEPTVRRGAGTLADVPPLPSLCDFLIECGWAMKAIAPSKGYPAREFRKCRRCKETKPVGDFEGAHGQMCADCREDI